jgi:uncharacterized protein
MSNIINNRLTSTDILHFIKNNKDYLFDKYGLVKIGIFGSFAREEQKSDSDIDLIIELKKDTQNIYEIKTELKNYFSSHFNRKIDIAREKYIKPRIKSEILKEAIYA